jgi:hypothetical protein
MLGLVVGVLAALVEPVRYGGDHSCPGGAPLSACTYPPDLIHQRIAWGLTGLAAGALAALLAWLFMLWHTTGGER